MTVWRRKCPVCSDAGVARIRVPIDPKCGKCGSSLKLKSLFGLELLTSAIVNLAMLISIPLSVYYLSALPFFLAVLAWLLLESFWPLRPDEKDLITQLQLKRARGLRTDAT